jgi:integrase
MKRTDLARSAEEYLALRRALGFKLRHETWFLPQFVAFLAAHGSEIITTDLAVRWAQLPAAAEPNWWARRLGAVRRFARHHRSFDPRTEVPPPDLIPFRSHRLTPHIYTDREVAALMRQARALRGALRSVTHATLLGLLAATGMRVGEALALDDADVDWNRSLLTVRHAKFQKSRLVPVHASTLAALRAYVACRDRLIPRRRCRGFFVSRGGARVLHQNFHHTFLRLLRLASLDKGPGRRSRLHDLRHTFAMKTLRSWYRSGVDAERRMASLSTYLGHVSPTSTYWYLTATPELLALAGKRLEKARGVRP